jgi:hypothetical protein
MTTSWQTNISSALRDQIKAGTMAYYVACRFSYSDTFGVHTSVDYCFQYVPSKQLFHMCLKPYR